MITVLGVAGGRVPPGTEELLASARVVAGGAAALRELAPRDARQVVLGAGVDGALDALGSDAVVLASGDPGFFGIVRALRRRFEPDSLAVHPAPSSVALAFARLGMPWDDALVVSAHARDPRPALATALRHPKVAILTDGEATPTWFAARLRDSGRRLAVCSRLGLDGEAITEGTPDEVAGREWDQPNVLVSLGADAAPAVDGWALPEADFDHRSGMITKREVRAVALAALGPATGRLIWDVGCGSGSVAVECARLGAAVFAVDNDPDAIARTRANAERFGVPVGVVEGDAPAALAALPDPDAVFVGGGGDDVEAILDAAARETTRTIVVTLALIERVGPVLTQLAALGFTAEATLLQASRLAPLAGGHRLAATNPITIAVGRR